MKNTFTLSIVLAVALALWGCSGREASVSFDEQALQAAIIEVEDFIATLPEDHDHGEEGHVHDGTEDHFHEFDVSSPEVEAQIKNAAKTWKGFKQLCDAGEYEKALDYYFQSGNKGDIMVYLRHSTPRFLVYSRVLWPMLKEYREMGDALGQYIDILTLEKTMEELTMTMGEEHRYMPDFYPDLLQELGYAFSAYGSLDKAMELVDPFAESIYSMTADPNFTNYMLTEYSVNVYRIAGDSESPKDIIGNYREMISRDIAAGADKNELDYYLKKAESLLD